MLRNCELARINCKHGGKSEVVGCIIELSQLCKIPQIEVINKN